MQPFDGLGQKDKVYARIVRFGGAGKTRNKMNNTKQNQ